MIYKVQWSNVTVHIETSLKSRHTQWSIGVQKSSTIKNIVFHF